MTAKGWPVYTRLRIALIASAAAMAWLVAERSAVVRQLLFPMNVFIARATEQVILWLGMDAQRRLATLTHAGGFGCEIGLACTGIFPAGLLAAAILAAPAPFRARLWGSLLGMLCALILNLIRLVSLFHLGVQHPAVFGIIHSVVWPGAMIAFLICFFQGWKRSIKSCLSSRSPIQEA